MSGVGPAPASARFRGPRPGRPVVVRVPATSANLGPGFDALGLALTLHDVVEARIIPDGISIEVSGAGEDRAAAGEDHLVIRAMRAAFGMLGGQPPGIGLRCVNAIPQGYGLGSSAGAIVAGLLAARALGHDGGSLTDAELLSLATQIEGHPDNVSACLAGGLTIAWRSSSGVRTARLALVPGLTPVVCVPELPLATAEARQVVPPPVPHAAAPARPAPMEQPQGPRGGPRGGQRRPVTQQDGQDDDPEPVERAKLVERPDRLRPADQVNVAVRRA